MQQSEGVTDYEHDLRTNIGHFAHGPVRQRPCRDVLCLVFLVMMIVGLSALGYKSVQNYNIIRKEVGNNVNIGRFNREFHRQYDRGFGQYFSQTFQRTEISKTIGLIVAMGLVSLAVSFLYLVLLQKFPRQLIYISLAIAFLLILASFIGCLITGRYLAALLTGLFLVIFIGMFCAFGARLDAVIVITKLTTHFMFSNISVYTIPIVVSIISVLVSTIVAFGTASTLSLLQYGISSQLISSQYFGLSAVVYIFFTVFFYYALVYLVSSAVANWFYMQGQCSGCAGITTIISHIGSLTFASMLIVVVRIIRAVVDSGRRQSQNCLSCVCFTLLQCFLACIEALLQTLNHMAISIMSVTGQSFIDAAKTASVLFNSQIQLFALVSSVSSTLVYSGVLFTVFIPAIIAFFVAQAILATPFFIFFATILISLPISMLFLSTFFQAMHALFIFYALQIKMIQYGLKPRPVTPVSIQTADQFMQINLSQYNPKQIMDIGYQIVQGYSRY